MKERISILLNKKNERNILSYLMYIRASKMWLVKSNGRLRSI